MNNIRLMAIDWGTTVARAYAMDREGRVVRSVRGDFGVQKIAHGDFASALAELRNHDMRDVPVLACGAAVLVRGLPSATAAGSLAPR